MYYIGIYMRVDPPVVGQPVPPAGYFALVCVFLFACFFQFGWGPVCWIYVSEIPAARLRSLNVAIAAAVQWLFNFVVARATPNMMATMGKGGYGYVFFFFFTIPEIASFTNSQQYFPHLWLFLCRHVLLRLVLHS